MTTILKNQLQIPPGMMTVGGNRSWLRKASMPDQNAVHAAGRQLLLAANLVSSQSDAHLATGETMVL
jgi:hypothetical protein